MPVKAAQSTMSATQRNGVWAFIALLAALAFLRSLSPEYTASAIQGLIKPNISTTRSEMEELNTLRNEVKREKIALHRLREELNQTSDLLRKYEELQNAQQAKGVVPPDHVAQLPPDSTHAVPGDGRPDDMHSAHGHNQAEERADGTDQERDHVDPADSDESTENADGSESVQLLDGECPTVIAIESSKSGLGTQIEHVVSLLSVAFSIQNACVVLPPINAQDGDANFRPVAFREIFDESEFLGTGVRFVPLSVCKTLGTSHIFDDRGAESAIVKNFAAFVHETHPKLAEETTLVHQQSKGHRFENASVVGSDVTIMGRYIIEKSGDQDGRKCIGFGRMRAEVAINLDILEHLRPASAIAEYVSFKYPAANETMFVKLRWNKSFCENARTEPETVCIFSDNILPTEEYVRSIAYTAKQADASYLYLSMPAYVPDDVSEYIYSNLKVGDPVLLDVDGDFFTASLIEHELAVRSKIFVPDGGAWGGTVQLLRSSRNSVNFRSGYDSKLMVQEWKDAGWPADSHFLKQQNAFVETHVEGLENASDGEHPPENVNNDSMTASREEDNAQQEEPVAVDVQNTYAEHAGLSPQLEGQSDGGNQVNNDSMTASREEDNAQQEEPVAVDVQDTYAEHAGLSPQLEGQSNGGNHVPNAPSSEHRPDQYIPPEGYIPSEESDTHILLNTGNSDENAEQAQPAEPITGDKSAELVAHNQGKSGAAEVLTGSQPPPQEQAVLPNTIIPVTQNVNTQIDLPVAVG